MKTLAKIEKELDELDPEALSFDPPEAERCKAALVRIVEKATSLYGKIGVMPAVAEQDYAERMAQLQASNDEAERIMKKRAWAHRVATARKHPF
jgi:hypothetical protein